MVTIFRLKHVSLITRKYLLKTPRDKSMKPGFWTEWQCLLWNIIFAITTNQKSILLATKYPKIFHWSNSFLPLSTDRSVEAKKERFSPAECQWKCGWMKECLRSRSLICDGRNDCPHGLDEAWCPRRDRKNRKNVFPLAFFRKILSRCQRQCHLFKIFYWRSLIS